MQTRNLIMRLGSADHKEVRLENYLARKAAESNGGQQILLPGDLSGHTLVEAAVECLIELGPPSRATRALIEKMESRGWSSSATSLFSTVFGTLRRESLKENNRVAKHGKKWALPDWPEEEKDEE